MNPKIFFVNGIAKSGKDSFVDFISIYAAVKKLSSIDEVKLIAASSFGWDGAKDDKGRALLSALKDAWSAYNDGPAQSIKASLPVGDEPCKFSAIFVMVREFKEMIKMQKMVGGSTLLVVNNRVEPCKTEQAFLDQVPKDYEYDYIIHNNWELNDLQREARSFAQIEVFA